MPSHRVRGVTAYSLIRPTAVSINLLFFKFISEAINQRFLKCGR